MSKQVRVRFAPSPTGPYILASSYRIIQLFVCQKKKWCFFLRIEDTIKRFVPGAEEYHGSSRMVRIAPDETIGKMKIWPIPPKRKKRFVPTICC
jgi:glutamyl-tRNA synthetase